MTKPVSGATDVPEHDEPSSEARETEREALSPHDDARHDSLRHPPHGEPDPESGWSEYIDDRTTSGGAQTGSRRGVVGREAQPDVRSRSDRPRGQPPAGAEPEDVEARANQHAGLRRYRGTSRGFRAEPGPLARSGEPPATRSDASIGQDVRHVLERDGMIEPGDLDVQVDEGKVHLRGHVPSERARLRAGNLVTSVSGVRAVYNDLEVYEPE